MYIRAFHKNKESIVGHIPLLGLFEVKEDVIEPFQIKEKKVFTLGEDIFLITEIMNKPEIHEIGIYDTDFLWYQIIPNRMGGVYIGEADGKNTVLMFEPSYLHPIIEKFITKYDKIIQFPNFTKPAPLVAIFDRHYTSTECY